MKNFGWALLAMAAVFAGLSLDSTFRRTAADEYGRLFGTQVAVPNDGVAPRPATPVVAEAPVRDQTVADPMLVAPAAREQILQAPAATMTPSSVTTTPSRTEAVPDISVEPPPGRGSAKGVAIVGDESGVLIVRTGTQERPRLAGGIFRQP